VRAPTTEQETALERKAEATIAAHEEEEYSEEEGQLRLTCRRVRVVAAAAGGGRNRAALKGEQLASYRAEARQNRLTNSAGFNEGDKVWLYRHTRNRGKSTEEPPVSTTWSTGSSGILVRK
jgi:hypothetical protein